MIKFTNVTKKYKDTLVLNNLTFELPSTGLVVIRGQHGSGKSTLINLVGGLTKPSIGTITSFGQTISELSEDELAKYREENVAFVFQIDDLFDNLTAEENIKIVGATQKYDEVVDILKLQPILNKKAKNLSIAEKARVSLARAVIKDTKIILVDELSPSIDEESKNMINDLIYKLSKNHLIFVVNPSQEFQENFGDFVLTLRNHQLADFQERFRENSENTANSYHNTFKIGKFALKNIFINKKKMIIISVLFILAFIFAFLTTSLSTLDIRNTHADTMIAEDDTVFFIQKKINGVITDFENEEEAKSLESHLGGPVSIGKKIDIENSYINFVFDYSKSSTLNSFYSHKISEVSFYSIDDCKELVEGSLPDAQNEIVVTSYFADLMIKLGIKDIEGNIYKPIDYEEIVQSRQELNLADIPVVITGIMKLDLDKFENLKDEEDEALQERMQEYLSNVADHIYVKPEFYELFRDYRPSLEKNYKVVLNSEQVQDDDDNTHQSSQNLNFNIFKDPVALKRSDDIIENLREDQIIVNGTVLEGIKKNSDSAIGSIIELYFENTKTHQLSQPMTFEIVGISADNKNYMNKSAMRDYLVKTFSEEKVEYEAKDKEEILKILSTYENSSDYEVTTNYSYKFTDIASSISTNTYIVGGIGIAIALITIFYTINYIKNSIQLHKKSIALLKSFGVKDKTILPMFTIEMSVLTLATYIISLVLFFILRIIINALSKKIISFSVNFVPISVFYIILVFAIALVILLAISIILSKKIKFITPQDLKRK